MCVKCLDDDENKLRRERQKEENEWGFIFKKEEVSRIRGQLVKSFYLLKGVCLEDMGSTKDFAVSKKNEEGES